VQQNGRFAAGTARKIGGGAAPATGMAPRLPLASVRGWLLKGFAVSFTWPLFLALLRGSFRDAAALVAAIVLLFVAGNLIARGCREEAQNEGRTLALSPLPWRLFGSVAAGVAAFAVSFGPAHDNVAMALLFGVLTGLACVLTYGLDPRADRAAIEAAAKRAGIKSRDVVTALEEAHAKVRGIEQAVAGLRSRELRSRLERICDQARAILGQLEQDPSDLSRARRFLVTYLDGTRDVVGKYAKQQHDVADTPLAANFRQVLTTVEQVFAEQQEVLRGNERLDLEVQIEVLETQLKREGIH
jgi:5-bromo-4-chloroindolyl phosphate hydrolysis protein